MTAATIDTRPATPPAPRRWLNVVRMHITNPWPTLILPWIILVGVFALNFMIWTIIRGAAGGVENLDDDPFTQNGGVSWILIYLIVIAVQSMNLTFRFSLGMSVTRRDYYVGTVTYFASLALLYSVGLMVFAAIERATDGWGVGAAFFAPWFMIDMPLWQVGLSFLIALLGSFGIGAFAATVWVRWRAIGLYVYFGCIALLLIGSGLVATATNSWGDVGRFFTDNEPLTVIAWSLVPTTASILVAWLLMRRASVRD